MPSPWYDELRGLFPHFNLEVRQLAHSLGELLPDWLGGRYPQWGHSAWEMYAHRFVKFALGPLLCNLHLARSLAELSPGEVQITQKRP